MRFLAFIVCVSLAFIVGCGSDQDPAQSELAAMAKVKDAMDAQLQKALSAVTAADDKIAALTKQLGAADLQLTEDRQTIEKQRNEIAGLKSRLATAEKAARANEQEAAGKSNSAN